MLWNICIEVYIHYLYLWDELLVHSSIHIKSSVLNDHYLHQKLFHF